MKELKLEANRQMGYILFLYDQACNPLFPENKLVDRVHKINILIHRLIAGWL